MFNSGVYRCVGTAHGLLDGLWKGHSNYITNLKADMSNLFLLQFFFHELCCKYFATRNPKRSKTVYKCCNNNPKMLLSTHIFCVICCIISFQKKNKRKQQLLINSYIQTIKKSIKFLNLPPSPYIILSYDHI